MDIALIIRSELFLITLTFLLFGVFSWIQKKSGIALLNPMIFTIASLIGFLKLTGISYGEYYESGRMIEFWLKPAIVALALPLYNELKHIRSQFIPLLVAELTGCVVGIVSVVLIASWLGASEEVIRSLAPEIGVNAYRHRNLPADRGYSGSDFRDSSYCWYDRRSGRAQDDVVGKCEGSGVQKPEHGDCGACDRHEQNQRIWRTVWSLRNFRTYNQRNSYRIPCRTHYGSDTWFQMMGQSARAFFFRCGGDKSVL